MATWFCPTPSADRDEHPDPVVRRTMLVLRAVHLGHTRQQAADPATPDEWRERSLPAAGVTAFAAGDRPRGGGGAGEDGSACGGSGAGRGGTGGT